MRYPSTMITLTHPYPTSGSIQSPPTSAGQRIPTSSHRPQEQLLPGDQREVEPKILYPATTRTISCGSWKIELIETYTVTTQTRKMKRGRGARVQLPPTVHLLTREEDRALICHRNCAIRRSTSTIMCPVQIAKMTWSGNSTRTGLSKWASKSIVTLIL